MKRTNPLCGQTIWNLEVPICTGYAELLDVTGDKNLGRRCRACGSYPDWKEPDLLVEWDDGSSKIADFVFAIGAIIARDTVSDQILEITRGFEKRPLTYYDHPNLYPPKRATPAKLKKRVWLPYAGPPLSRLLPTCKVDLDPMSTVEIEFSCSKCGTIQYKRLRDFARDDDGVPQSRDPDQGLFVKAEQLQGCGVFSPKFLNLFLCTNDVKEFIESQKFTNVEFLDFGTLL